jgi:N6-adenosine-specific RNA methylase IME4/ParB-like chromosome segregation protein Spo0J
MSHTTASNEKQEPPIEITISKEYEKLVPALHKDDYDSLKDSVKKHGQYIPIVINEENVILDGHHRYKICNELKIEPRYEIRRFENKLLEKKFVIESNLSRRHLNDFQKAELGRELEKVEAELAKQRMLTGKKDPEANLPQGDGEKRAPQTRDIVSEKIGVKPRTYQKAKVIIENATEELKEKVRKGTTSIDYAFKQVKRSDDNKKERPPLPQGQFDVILADPPWKYEINTRGSPDEHYGVMEDNAIQDMKIPAADNAILFLWGTAPKLVEALDVMKAWGFEYKTNAVWIKDKIGTGYYFRGQHELLLIGVRGKGIGVPVEASRPSSVIEAPRKEHSQKPEVVYDIIEKMYPGHKYLELFARGNRWSDSWTIWGQEAE